MSALPDPLRYAARTLERLGGLVEVAHDRASAVLPGEVASRLGLPDGVELGEGAVGCGIGSPLLEALVEHGRAAVPFATASTSLLPPRDGATRALAERYVVRNGVASVEAVGAGPAAYLVVALAWTVQADERYEGLVVGAVEPEGGGRPAVALHLDPALADEPGAGVERPEPGLAARWVARLGSALVEPAVAEPLATTARRQVREHDRIRDYYRQLIVEARRPKRRVDRSAIEAKVAHLVAERDGRLADLGHRYAARVTARLAAALVLGVTAGHATMRVRRRKGERQLLLRLPPGARSFDLLPCDGCDGWIDEAGPVLCDDRLHLLCARCAPEASGRPRCPACGAHAPRRGAPDHAAPPGGS